MRITHVQTALTLASIGLAGIIVASPPALGAAAEGTIAPVMSCEALAKADLTRQDAQITSTATATREGHAYCDVKGYISPVTQFEALLPLETWRGDYLQQGCGGLCGHVDVDLKDPSRTSGYQAPYAPLMNGEMVVAADDEGHETASNGDGEWAKTDPELRLVFGYLSEHQLAQAAKALIRTFYGREPAYSYFSGVSDGGHEALVLAQRYPEDFNGIIAGAPANNWAALGGMFETWVAQTNRNAEGKQILTAEKLPALHAAVMAACANKQGVIEDPRACTFDPASIRCADGVDRQDCLTDEQVKMVRDEYRGPHDAQGRNLFDGGEPYGSEPAWSFWLVMPAADAAAPGDVYATLGIAYLNDMAFWSNPKTPYTVGSVPFTADMHQQLEQLGGIYNATDPDLDAFRAHGGKIIIYHSWADQAIPPFATLDYYRAVANQMGGYQAIQSFSRLYMVPGLYHCPCGQPVDGDPATTVQFMPQLVAWVEHGDAPGDIVLPVTAQSTGEHLTELTISPFDPLKPAPQNNGLNSNYDYIGASSDYRKGNALWCSWDGPTLACSPRS
ncbi:MAG: tannase/feruloyl esterase family alpha/beta hydrolase [Roseiarcus sp.]|uniref:tannase/feruloyl esterase family alpha/beta hydrolase n=1 Tax=Roseiarcus sp. TaxID=1969460 RepID=UPI003BB1CCAF